MTQQEIPDAVVALIEQAMMTGYLVIRDRQQVAVDYYANNPDCGGGDMLRAALGNEPTEFAQIRRDLVSAVLDGAA